MIMSPSHGPEIVAFVAALLLGSEALAADAGATGAETVTPETGAVPDAAPGGTLVPHVRTPDRLQQIDELQSKEPKPCAAQKPGPDAAGNPVAEMLESYGVPVGRDKISSSPCFR
jgi:hypothetical protein